MFSDTVAGGLANVHWLNDISADELNAAAKASFAHGTTEHVQVFVAGGNGRYLAESYSPGGARIKFCGHGALAAAWVIFNQQEPAAQLLQFRNADRSWQAHRSVDNSTDMTLVYKQPALSACAVPGFAAAALGVQPVAAAEAGGPTDYLILELADVAVLSAMQPDFAAITAGSQRALIVTARDSPSGCAFRYFAPQYGTPEDAATGSAAVQLAVYWSRRLRPDICVPGNCRGRAQRCS